MNLLRMFPTPRRRYGSKRDRTHRRRIAFEPLEERELLAGGLQVGMNVSSVSASESNMFVNVMKMANPQWRITPASNPGWKNISGVSVPPLDGNGYPTGLGNLSALGDAVYTNVFVQNGQTYPTGTYTLTFDGTGTVAINDYVDPIQYFTQNGGTGQTHNVTISGTYNWGIAIAITSSSSSDYVSNIHLVMPGFQSTYQTEPFNPQYLSTLQPFSTLRVYNFMLPDIASATTSDGQSGELTWAERTPTTYFTQSVVSGVSVEYLVQLCNTLHDNLWVTMPINADSNYELNFAQYVEANLDPTLKVYVEYGNEIWDSTFSYESKYVISYATANGINVPQAMADLTTYNCWNVWTQVFAGQPNRMARVVAAQFSVPAMFTGEITQLVAISSPTDPNHGFDVIAGGAYFGPVPSSFNAQTTVQQIEAAELAALKGRFTQQLQAFMTMATSWEQQLNQNIPVIMYEGGLGLAAVGSPPWYSAFVATQTDAGQYPIIMAYLNELEAAGVTGVNFYELIEHPNAWGEYGSMDYLGEPSSLTPKYNALVNFLTSPYLTIAGTPSVIDTGVAEQFTVTVMNPDGAGVDTGYTGTVQFSSSDPLAVLPADYTFTAADQGTHSFSFTLATVGMQSLTVADVAAPVIWGVDSVIVESGGTSAVFLPEDTATRGNWIGTYGMQAYDVVGNNTSLPAYASLAVAGESTWVWKASTRDPRALQNSNGSGRVAAGWYANSSFTVTLDLTDGEAHVLALYVDDWDKHARSEQIQISDAFTGTVLDTESISSFSNGVYLDWRIVGSVVITITNLGPSNVVLSGLFLSSAVGNTASFVNTDTTTQGTWMGTYGVYGYNVIGATTNNPSYPSYATVTASGYSTWVWSANTTDVRGLQNPNGSGRIAAAWFGSSIKLDINLTDGQTYDLALYAVDWDNKGRSEKIQISDAVTGTVLDTETLSSFVNGVYEVWTVSGHVEITISVLAGNNAVVNGLFFMPVPTFTDTFVKSDTTTQGNWMGTYGADGYNIIGATTNNPSYPSYATVTASGYSTYTWSSNTTDPRGLQDPSGSGRIAAAWYSSTSFTVNVNLTDGQTHDLTIYAVDWDNHGRKEQIQIIDASTGVVQDTETLSSFSGGVYLEWAVSGNVEIKVTSLTGGNALINGLFFDKGSVLAATSTLTSQDPGGTGPGSGSIGTVPFSTGDSLAPLPADSTSTAVEIGALGRSVAAKMKPGGPMIDRGDSRRRRSRGSHPEREISSPVSDQAHRRVRGGKLRFAAVRERVDRGHDRLSPGPN